MDVAHAILFAKTIDISRVTADYSSAKFELFIASRGITHVDCSILFITYSNFLLAAILLLS